MRILIVQWAGDFREAWNRLQTTGKETYHGHAYVLDQLAEMRERFGEVAIMCCLSPERYREVLPNGVTVIGAQAHPRKQAAEVRRQMAAWAPTHLVVLGPMPSVIRWGLTAGTRTMCQFADSFDINPLVRLMRYGRLARLLNDPRVEWVSNHGVNACRSLLRLGVDPAKVLSWDYPHVRRPDQTVPRSAPPTGEPSLLFVGTLQPAKGVGDVIEAVATLQARGQPVRLRIAGGGQVDRFRALAERKGVADRVDFLGLIANSEVFERMQAATAVVVPSRPAYPEGLPITITEALCARAPIIASDHPMFAGHLIDHESALVFPAGNATVLADKVEELLADPALHARLSERAELTWQRMQNPVKWGDTLTHWFGDTPADRQWLADHRLPADQA